jgi:hypothetical protein
MSRRRSITPVIWQHPVSQRGFAVVDVGDDAEVAKWLWGRL